MTQEQLTALLAQVQGNANLQETLSAAQTPEEVVRIAHAQGYEVSSDDLIPPTEHDLEGMAGGRLLQRNGSPNLRLTLRQNGDGSPA